MGGGRSRDVYALFSAACTVPGSALVSTGVKASSRWLSPHHSVSRFPPAPWATALAFIDFPELCFLG